MFSALSWLLKYVYDYRAKLHVVKNPNIEISDSARIAAYRKLHVETGCKLKIGNLTIIEGNITTECIGANISIGSRTFIGGSHLISASKIIIGDDVLISWGCTIVDHDSHSIAWSKRSNDVLDWAKGEKNWEHVNRGCINIHNKVWIGANVTILKNVTIGEGAVIGTGSVVTKNVPAWTVVAGNPAKVIKVISENER